jgi:Plavaka transposase
MTGGRVAHPLLISLANIFMDFRMKGSNRAFLLLALLPVPKFIHKDRSIRGVLESRMIHECLDFILKPLKKAAEIGIMMSDPAGSIRHFFTPLAAYMVDVQEALLLAAVAGKTSHLTMATYKQFGDPFRHDPRTTSTTLAQLHALEQTFNPWNLKPYVKAAKKRRLNGVHRPFYRDWPLSDPSNFLTPEPLHHWHKMFWDHDAKWCIRILGGAEIDFRFSILHPHTGFRQFHEGISKLNQVTGREHREIQRYIVPVIADAVPKDFLISIRSLMDFRYLAQAPQISDQTCTEIDLALKKFHDHKSTIISSGARTGKGGKVIDNWYIPKLELLQSVTSSIRESGAAIQWTADTTERYHITEIKAPSDCSNNQGFEAQICRHLDRGEKSRQFDIATTICEASADMPHLVDVDDDDSLSEDPRHEPEGRASHPVTTTTGLLSSLRTVAPISGTIRRCGDYFELASALQRGLYPHAPLPFRTVVNGVTAFHLTRDPAMKMTISDIMGKFDLPDLCGALADFLDRLNGGQPLKIGGRRTADINSPLPFDHLQVWTKVQLQNRSYHTPHHILPPQTINALPPSEAWAFGRCDVVLINTDNNKVWPHSGLEGISSCMFISSC